MIHAARFSLLRRHVSRCADAGEIRHSRSRGIAFSQHLRDTEVRDFHASVFIEEQVFGLDVPVHDSVFVRKLQRFADGRHDGQRLLRCEASRFHRLPQIHAIDELHQQEKVSARLPEVVDGHDVRMVQPGERLRFVAEAFRKHRIAHALRSEEFQSDETVERFLPRFVNDAHPAATKAVEDFELRKMRREFLRPRQRRANRNRRIIERLRAQPRKQTLWAKPLRRVGGKRRCAIRALCSF